MSYIAAVLILLVGGSSFAGAQTAAGSSGGSGYARGTLSTGHTISGTAGPSGPNPGSALHRGSTGNDPDASSVTPAPSSHDNAVDTPAAEKAANSLGNTSTGVLRK